MSVVNNDPRGAHDRFVLLRGKIPGVVAAGVVV
jgi:hypothetical protein